MANLADYVTKGEPGFLGMQGCNFKEINEIIIKSSPNGNN